MNLIQKLSTATLLSTSLAGVSGCGHVAGALISGAIAENEGKLNRQAMLEAAQIQAGQPKNNQNYPYGYYVPGSTTPKSKNPGNDFFICLYKGDINKNGKKDYKDYHFTHYKKLERDVFDPSDPLSIGCLIFNNEGSRIGLRTFDDEGSELGYKEFHASESDYRRFWDLSLKEKRPGVNKAVFEMDGKPIHEINYTISN